MRVWKHGQRRGSSKRQNAECSPLVTGTSVQGLRTEPPIRAATPTLGVRAQRQRHDPAPVFGCSFAPVTVPPGRRKTDQKAAASAAFLHLRSLLRNRVRPCTHSEGLAGPWLGREAVSSSVLELDLVSFSEALGLACLCPRRPTRQGVCTRPPQPRAWIRASRGTLPTESRALEGLQGRERPCGDSAWQRGAGAGSQSQLPGSSPSLATSRWVTWRSHCSHPASVSPSVNGARNALPSLGRSEG